MINDPGKTDEQFPVSAAKNAAVQGCDTFKTRVFWALKMLLNLRCVSDTHATKTNEHGSVSAAKNATVQGRDS